jgi:hypothetical protein
MEAIILILTYACSKNVKAYHMDVKSNFLNGELEEEVWSQIGPQSMVFQTRHILTKSRV